MEDPDVQKLQKLLTELGQTKTAISKQQIVEVSKLAIAGIRHFKHVVHAIEKFVLKCKIQHKLFGFYMIDSIVRQAQKKYKHKDVFGPRFAVNLSQTLINALGCPTKDRARLVRVLNLWQANSIFPDDVIMPLLQHCRASGIDVDVESVEKAVKGEKADMSRYKNGNFATSANDSIMSQSGFFDGGPPPAAPPQPSVPTIVDPALISNFLLTSGADYGKGIVGDAEALKRVQKLVNSKVKERLDAEPKNKIQNILSAEFDYSDEEEEKEATSEPISRERIEKLTQAVLSDQSIQHELRKVYLSVVGSHNENAHGSSDRDRKRRRSTSRDRRPSESTDRKRERHRDRRDSREKDRHRRHRSNSPRHRGNEEKKEKERKKLGFPIEVKREHFLIGSRTIWLGRLPPNTSESEIKQALDDIGDPDRVEIINSRACAYITMPDRRSAFKIIDKMSNKLEVARKLVKVSWATGQGLKDKNELNPFWEADKGYHQIPWNYLPNDIAPLFAGGFADVETLPPKYRGIFDEVGNVIKAKSPPPPVQAAPINVPMPPAQVAAPVLPPNLSALLPPGIGLPSAVPPPSASDQQATNQTNLELLMAAAAAANANNAVNNQPGLLGAPPPLNPALLNLNPQLFNVQQQLAAAARASGGPPPTSRFSRDTGGPGQSLPDQQAAFNQFRGGSGQNGAPRFNQPPTGFRPSFSPRGPRPSGFNNPPPTRFSAIGDMSRPPPNLADLSGSPLRFGSQQPPPFNLNNLPPGFSLPPPNAGNPMAHIIPDSFPQESQDMDIASPEGPPGV
uniref:CID domain-containing protein n=1 Tax=Panagrellus redivivus TaxID=6233 RepID=A0A7E4VTZ8_PANRE